MDLKTLMHTPCLLLQLLKLGDTMKKYTGVTNYRCTYCLRQSIKQTLIETNK